MILEGKKLLTIDWDNENHQKRKKNVSAIKLKNLVRKKQFLVKLESAIWVKETNRFFQEHTFCFVSFSFVCCLSFAMESSMAREKKKFQNELRVSESESLMNRRKELKINYLI